MGYEVIDNKLYINGNKVKTKFKVADITSVLEYDNLYIALVCKSIERGEVPPPIRNIYAYDQHGNFKWQIQDAIITKRSFLERYFDFLRPMHDYFSDLYVDKNNVLTAYGTAGVEWIVNSKDGSITLKHGGMRSM